MWLVIPFMLLIVSFNVVSNPFDVVTSLLMWLLISFIVSFNLVSNLFGVVSNLFDWN